MLSLLVAFMLFLQPLAAQAAPNKTVNVVVPFRWKLL